MNLKVAFDGILVTATASIKVNKWTSNEHVFVLKNKIVLKLKDVHIMKENLFTQ